MREYQAQHGLDPNDATNSVTIAICHGKPRCTARTRKDKKECVWCYNLSSNDMRSTVRVIEDMERMHS